MPECPTSWKKAYPCKDHATQAMRKEWRQGRGKHMPIRVYHCSCGCWHTTSKPYKWWRR